MSPRFPDVTGTLLSMQIDRRITNGLAWAGAVLVVAIPVADFAMRQAAPGDAPQVAIVQAEAAAPSAPATLPTPSAQRPAVAAAEPSVEADEEDAVVAEAEDVQSIEADPVVTATTRPTGTDPVNTFLQSGRELPSYISGGTSRETATTTPVRAPSAPAQAAVAAPIATPAPAAPAAPAAANPVTTTTTASSQPTPAGAGSSVATVSRTVNVTMPTPVSQRPPSVAQSQLRPAPVPVQQQPLIVDDQPPVLTADDLEEWESGPLSDFLAGRRGQVQQAPESDYDSDGFFLDQGPNNGRQQPFPRAYGEGFYYPFSN